MPINPNCRPKRILLQPSTHDGFDGESAGTTSDDVGNYAADLEECGQPVNVNPSNALVRRQAKIFSTTSKSKISNTAETNSKSSNKTKKPDEFLGAHGSTQATAGDWMGTAIYAKRPGT